eukprot:CAMPEP_0197182374 /NCGR_PEP_ID=MMETSP1423-20130617/6353_1 /TAXON_ID=476441 /ORGANISM="Pseudo-nitzschia heimii, Strain UNC1101" /LENGTH=290 /DNA_ID=CAMNT_0042632787 /DNA_START=49 /DNA_END=921 /DNA_ORIENTATION=-
MPQSYYDIDAILAEEELVPCTTLFEFSHLADLDPDGIHHQQQQQQQHQNEAQGESSAYLPENSRIKVPLWAVEKWATLGFVRLQLPRHYGRRARERYEADPGDANLRKRNERFFLSGRRLVHLIEQSSTQVAKAIASLPRSRKSNSNSMIRHTQALRQVSEEARSLRRTLLQTYAGERLRKAFDWSQSGAGGTGSGDCDDDVSGYLNQLTEMEQRLYYAGSLAVASLEEWKIFGNRRLLMGLMPTTTSNDATPMATASPNPTSSSTYKRSVTPGEEMRELEPIEQKRRLQ